MASGTVTVTLRPLKFAMLVELGDCDALLQAIRINVFLWGGIHNPIIPIFSETPKNWYEDWPLPTPAEILSGYVRFFDPDILVACGKIDPSKIETRCRRVISAEEITMPIASDGIPGYGIGLPELLAELGQKEFKFIRRRDQRKVLVPMLPEPTDPLLAAIFGDVPPEANQIYQRFLQYVEAESHAVSIDNLFDFDRDRWLVRHDICSYGLKMLVPRSGLRYEIFYFDHNDPLDLIDYWNLRATGRIVIPLSKAVAQSEKVRTVARKFIQNQQQAVPVVKGRSIPKCEHSVFTNSLKCQYPDIAGKIFAQPWYPLMWDELDSCLLDCVGLVAETRETIIGDDSGLFIPALPPVFMMPSSRPRLAYANDLEIFRYGGEEFRAAVIPPDQQNLVRLFQVRPRENWRIGDNGPTFLGLDAERTMHLSQPNARDVIASVLESMGWKQFKISSSGNMAYQIMRHLRGPERINLLKNRQLLEYLEELSGSKMGPLTQHFFCKIERIVQENQVSVNVHELVKQYTDANIFTLGLQVQCPTCTQRSWYGLDTVNYEVQCPKCLSPFKLPIHDPKGELKWAYRSRGPFAEPEHGKGTYSVLLTVNFLAGYLHPATTTALSFTVQDDAGASLEVDFMMFYRNKTIWKNRTEWIFGECKSFGKFEQKDIWKNRTEWVFGECKSFGKFEQKDIERMKFIAEKFPDSILVFATLKENFDPDERKLLLPFVQECREFGKLGRPRNGVLLLTGTELFSPDEPPLCWKGKPGMGKQWADNERTFFSLLELCNATQQLYLGLGPWPDDQQDGLMRSRAADKGCSIT